MRLISHQRVDVHGRPLGPTVPRRRAMTGAHRGHLAPFLLACALMLLVLIMDMGWVG